MTTFDDREDTFERKFALDEELRFKATARRNRLLATWAAETAGFGSEAAADYAQAFVIDNLQNGDSDIANKISEFLSENGQATSAMDILSRMILLWDDAVEAVKTAR